MFEVTLFVISVVSPTFVFVNETAPSRHLTWPLSVPPELRAASDSSMINDDDGLGMLYLNCGFRYRSSGLFGEGYPTVAIDPIRPWKAPFGKSAAITSAVVFRKLSLSFSVPITSSYKINLHTESTTIEFDSNLTSHIRLEIHTFLQSLSDSYVRR